MVKMSFHCTFLQKLLNCKGVLVTIEFMYCTPQVDAGWQVVRERDHRAQEGINSVVSRRRVHERSVVFTEIGFMASGCTRKGSKNAL